MNSVRLSLHPFSVVLVALQILTLSFFGKVTGPLLGFAIVLGLAIYAGAVQELMGKLLVAAFPLCFFVFLLQALLSSDGTRPLFALGHFTVTAGGLLRAEAYAARIFLLLAVVVLVSKLLDWQGLGYALLQSGVPLVPAFIFMASLSLVPEIQLRFRRVVEAQQCRGIEISGSVLKRLKLLPSLLLPVTLGALSEAAARSVALEARGFSVRSNRIAVYRQLPDSTSQVWLRRVLLVTLPLTAAAEILLWLCSSARI